MIPSPTVAERAALWAARLLTALAVAALLAFAVAIPFARAQAPLPPTVVLPYGISVAATASLSATSTSSRVALGAYPTAWVSNASQNSACVVLGSGSVIAAWDSTGTKCPGGTIVPAGRTEAVGIGAAADLAAVTLTGSAALAIVEGSLAPATSVGAPSAPVTPYQYGDFGACQIVVGNAVAGLGSGIGSATSWTGACSAGIPAGANYATITVETEPMRWTGTGATNPPTQGFGNLAPVGSSFTYSAVLSGFRMNDTSAGSSTVDVEFFK